MSDQTAQPQSANDASPSQAAPAGGAPQMLPAREQTGSPAHRPGWQTTEFWVSVLTILAIVASALAGVLPPKGAATAAAIAASAYSISRSITKLGTYLF